MEGGERMGDRWSTEYGVHLLKSAAFLYQYYLRKKDHRALEIVDQICGEFIDKDNEFKIVKANLYTHACCYAIEGLISLTLDGYNDYSEIIQDYSSWLNCIQNEDGSLNNYHMIPGGNVKKVTDATGQAVRIWLYADRGKMLQVFHNPSNLRAANHSRLSLPLTSRLSFQE